MPCLVLLQGRRNFSCSKFNHEYMWEAKCSNHRNQISQNLDRLLDPNRRKNKFTWDGVFHSAEHRPHPVCQRQLSNSAVALWCSWQSDYSLHSGRWKFFFTLFLSMILEVNRDGTLGSNTRREKTAEELCKDKHPYREMSCAAHGAWLFFLCNPLPYLRKVRRQPWMVKCQADRQKGRQIDRQEDIK